MSRTRQRRWQIVCALEDLVEGTGVCALVGGRQIARVPGRRAGLRARQLRPGQPRQRAVARPHRRPAERARGRVAYLQASLLADERALHRRSRRSASRAYATRVADGTRAGRSAARGCAASRLVVAGNGMAGMRTVEELLKLGVADRFSDHRVRRRAARQLQPHPAVARARGRAAGRRHHAAPAGLVHAARHHAALGRSDRRRSTASGAWCVRAAARSRPTTGC